MSTEIEIKFVVTSDVKIALETLLQNYEILKHEIKPLSNTYFDTKTYQFRQFDFGLRIRRSVNFAEQTIKTAGDVRGGLHQRPEYNCPVSGETPTLSDFPAEIWPVGANISQLQADLINLFTTDFERTYWHIQMPNDAKIEVVFDEGMVRSGEDCYPLCEIELELITGEVDDLFKLAEQISVLGGVRLGNVSKAKRGYQLSGLYEPKVSELSIVSISEAEESLAAIFHNTLMQSYHHWQHHEQLYLETADHKALSEVLTSVGLIQQTVRTYTDILPENALKQADLDWLAAAFSDIESALKLEPIILKNGHLIRNFPERRHILKEVSELQDKCINFDDISALMSSKRYTSIMLAISRLLNKGMLQMNTVESVSHFAELHLERSWQNILNSPLAQDVLDAMSYIDAKTELKKNILLGQCFSDRYSVEVRNKFRLPWLDILQGIDDLEVIGLLMNVANMQSEKIAAPMKKILLRKEASLLDALEQTRQQALMMQPYWH